jgi:(E)-4-hydroxy-3-methylbut-2-enyl-diphosphate synthase
MGEGVTPPGPSGDFRRLWERFPKPLIQTMLKNPLERAADCRREIAAILGEGGCPVIRVAIPNRGTLDRFCNLQDEFSGAGIIFVADLHYGSELALEALEVFEKVRINPGNFATARREKWENYSAEMFDGERERVGGEAMRFFTRARLLGRGVRIGSNGGSPAARWLWKCGSNGEEALLRGALEMARWAEDATFRNLFFSFKHSDCRRSVRLVREASRRMGEMGLSFPFHLGVTEAGNGLEGRVKGAIGIAIPLALGLGETLRLSLSESSLEEVKFAKKLLHFFQRQPLDPGRIPERRPRLRLESDPPLADEDGLVLEIVHRIFQAGEDGEVPIAATALEQRIGEIALQAWGWGKFSTEIVACPTCGRTGYAVGSVVEKIRARLGHLPHLKIAVMGCLVNGVGEMGDADYGYIGSGRGLVNLYRHGECVKRGIAEERAIDELENLLARDGERVQGEASPCNSVCHRS